jgi:hypothetical protein
VDLGIYVGPFNIQIETGKMFDVNFPPGVPGCFSRRIVPLIGGQPGAIAIRLETMRTTLDRSGRWPL